jgi:hypothetical protein
MGQFGHGYQVEKSLCLWLCKPWTIWASARGSWSIWAVVRASAVKRLGVPLLRACLLLLVVGMVVVLASLLVLRFG